MVTALGLPSYDPLLRTSHRAFERELRRAIARLPLERTSRVLDLACGDGFFAWLLARRLDRRGLLVACDLRPEYLARARHRLEFASGPEKPCLRFALANAYRLPFDDRSFDFVWCAQSFISFAHPVRALQELRRVTRMTGHVAILESDELHHLLLPWPLDLEVGLSRAVREANLLRYGDPSKTSVGRKVPAMFAEAGLRLVDMKTHSGDRTAPFDAKVRRFLRCFLDSLRERAAEHLRPGERALFDEFADPAAIASIWRRPNAELTWLSTIYLGQRA